MLVVCISLLLLIGKAASKISLKEIEKEFKDNEGSLKRAGHLEGRELSELKAVLNDGGHFGVVLDIQNYSGLRLVDPAVYISSGWADPKFGKLHQIDPTAQDAFAFHNTWKTTKLDSWHSIGVASWLVLKPNGSPFTYTKYGREYEIRLWVYWENTNWYCSQDKPALVAVDFLGNSHNEDQSLAEEEYGAYFDELEGEKEESRSTAKNRRVRGMGLMAEVEAQSECNPLVTVKLASKNFKSHKISFFEAYPNKFTKGWG